MAGKKLKNWAAAVLVALIAALFVLIATQIMLPAKAENKLSEALQLPDNAVVKVRAFPALQLLSGGFDKAEILFNQNGTTITVICYDDYFDADFVERASEYQIEVDMQEFHFAEPFENIEIAAERDGTIKLSGPFEMWGGKHDLQACGSFVIGANGVSFSADDLSLGESELDEQQKQQIVSALNIPLHLEIPLDNATLAWHGKTLQIRSIVDDANAK